MTGKIKTLKADKGFGFITAEGLAKDLFFHKSALVGVTFEELKENEAVSFETETIVRNGEEKQNAKNVQRA